jgi:hypothetical protein
MSDIAAIGTILTSIKTATEIARLIKDSDNSLEQAEYKLKIADLVGALVDAKLEIASIQDLILEKDKENIDLRNKLNLKNKIIWHPPYYFIEENEERSGPYCQQCYDNNEKLIRLQSSGNGIWKCYTCKTSVKDSNYEPYTHRMN